MFNIPQQGTFTNPWFNSSLSEPELGVDHHIVRTLQQNPGWMLRLGPLKDQKGDVSIIPDFVLQTNKTSQRTRMQITQGYACQEKGLGPSDSHKNIVSEPLPSRTHFCI